MPKIADHMRSTKEWGEFFPIQLSPFCYNETVAMDAFPLQESAVKAYGWRWHAVSQPQDQYLGPPYDIPENIAGVGDDITRHVLHCERTGKPYKIIPQELKLYREMRLPIPRTCPDQRHRERMALRNPRHLWGRKCAKCQTDIQTTYAPGRPEKVYCEKCYLSAVY